MNRREFFRLVAPPAIRHIGLASAQAATGSAVRILAGFAAGGGVDITPRPRGSMAFPSGSASLS